MHPFFFDEAILAFFNKFAHKSIALDHFIYMISENNLLKGGVIIGVFYYLWWAADSRINTMLDRRILTITILSAFVAEIVCIILSLTLSYRARPFINPDIVFSNPVEPSFWWNNHISSLPSDHATLFMALWLGIFTCNKKIGWYSLAYIILVILLPRIYLGLHFPSDIVIGGLMGLMFVYIGLRMKIVERVADYFIDFSLDYPQFFYPLIFLISYQLVDLFTESREFLAFFRHPYGQ